MRELLGTTVVTGLGLQPSQMVASMTLIPCSGHFHPQYRAPQASRHLVYCRYEGEWSKGKMHGFGVLTWKDGSTYKGEWERGKMQGCGAWKKEQGSQAGSQEGQFLSSEFVGGNLACPVDTARFAAKEADYFAEKARTFVLPSP